MTKPHQSVLAFEMAKKSDEKAEIRIYNYIGPQWDEKKEVTTASFAKQLDALGDVKQIDLRINSGGGSVVEGNGIYNLLIQHPANITTYIDGMATSIASVIAMAGKTIKMPENTLMMIHNPSVFAAGDARSLRKSAEVLDQMKVGAVLTYMKRSGLDKKKIEKMMDDETWMTAKEAVELGFADEVTDSVEAVAQADLEALMAFGYRNIPNVSNALTPNPEVIGKTEETVPEVQTIVENEGDTTMSTPTPQAPQGANVMMTQADFDARLAQAVAKGREETMAAVSNMQLDGLRRDLAQMVTDGKLTPAQSKAFGQLAENLKGSDEKLSFSMKDDGSEVISGSAFDLIRNLAATMKHGLLNEQVPGNDSGKAPDMKIQNVAASEEALAKGFKLTKADIPEASLRTPDTAFMNAYINNVMLVANPGMKYAEAAVAVEKSQHYQAALKAFRQSV